MSQSKASGGSRQSANEPEEDEAKRRAGKPEKGSRNAKARVKAGTGRGAGGGSKQKQNH